MATPIPGAAPGARNGEAQHFVRVQALRKALQPHYPSVTHVQLADYKVRILNSDSGTAAVTPSTWNHSNQATTTYTLPGVLVKTGTALTSRTTASGTTNPLTRGVFRYVIGPLLAQTIASLMSINPAG